MSKTMKKGIIAAAVALCLAISCVLMKAPEKLPVFAETDGGGFTDEKSIRKQFQLKVCGRQHCGYIEGRAAEDRAFHADGGRLYAEFCGVSGVCVRRRILRAVMPARGIPADNHAVEIEPGIVLFQRGQKVYRLADLSGDGGKLVPRRVGVVRRNDGETFRTEHGA